MQKNNLSLILLLGLFLISCGHNSLKTIDVFHKNKKPSLQTLEKTNTILNKYKGEYEIAYYVITDSNNVELLQKYNLPGTHFPFAIVINSNFSAKINHKKIDFVHFPLFMHGIGRHEGNWSLADLETVLMDNTLLLETNILPNISENHDDDEPCSE
ncbi:MAG: hypothetical protein HN952_03160 [Candidatus Cloacimonetes bacterium]|nr:hypothetical protein [Candidatus Cloacimonadota bacterium]MBT6993935.1 hypothetical protein [Candidatus Cloacimonadota bacterium]MBT7470097.1 hypothetical protein [Candidatus Cloacimonadota bacterium]